MKPAKKTKTEEGIDAVAYATQMLKVLLASAKDARAFTLCLSSTGFAGELITKMESHATTMEKHYKVVNGMLKDNQKDLSRFEDYDKQVQPELQWFNSAAKTAKSMLLAAGPQPTKKGKKRPDDKDDDDEA
jgi:hypothetical protein